MDQTQFDELPSDSSESIIEIDSLNTNSNKEIETTLYKKLFGDEETLDSDSEAKLWSDSDSEINTPDWVNKQIPITKQFNKSSKSYKLVNNQKIFESSERINTLLMQIKSKLILIGVSKNSFLKNEKQFKTDFIISDSLIFENNIFFVSPFTSKIFIYDLTSKIFIYEKEKFKIINKPINEKGLKRIYKIIINNITYLVVLGDFLHILSSNNFNVLLCIKLPNIVDLCMNNDLNILYILTKDSVFEIKINITLFEMKYKSKRIMQNLFNTKSIYFSYAYLIIILKNCIKLLKKESIIKTLFFKKSNTVNNTLTRFYAFDYLLFMNLAGNLKTINLKEKVFMDFKPLKCDSLVGKDQKIYLSYKKSIFSLEIF